MRYASMVLGLVTVSLFALGITAGGAKAADAAAPQGGATPNVHLFDTGTPSPAPLSGEALTQTGGWTEVGAADLAHPFSGDAVLVNDKLAVVLRAGGPGLEIYSLGAAGPRLQAVAAPAADAPLAGLASVKATNAAPEAVTLNVSYHVKGAADVSLTVGMKMGEPQIETDGQGGLKAMSVQAPCRLVVLPDFFADDIVIDAAQLKAPQAELPTENMMLDLVPGEDAIVMAVWNTSKQDVQVSLSGEGEQRMITSSRIAYGEDPRIWIAVLSAPGVWYKQDIAADQAGKVISLDWKAPWPGHWRTDWTRNDGLVDSWEMLSQRQDGSYTKPNWFGSRERVPADRKRWTTVLGNFEYPCWIDQAGQGYLEPLAQPPEWNTHQVVEFLGPALIYPMNRLSNTPLDTFTVLDVVRTTLGVGPCEYILQTEAGKSTNKGIATCTAKERLDRIYEQGQQKEQRARVEKSLEDVLTFIRFIRSRIDTYVACGHDCTAYLEEQKAAHPELADSLDKLEKLAKLVDVRLAGRQEIIKTPDYAAQLADQFRATVLDKDDPDALARCQKITAAWVQMGGNQDHLAGELRWVVKFLRQRAGLLMAEDPRVADICKEVRRRCEVAMENPAGHEAIHH